MRSKLEYANSVWAPYKIKHIEALEKVKKRATRSLPGFKELSYEDRLKTLKLPTLVYRRIRGDMIETYKIMNGVYDFNVTPGLTIRYSDNLRGHSKILKKCRSYKSLRANSFTQRIVNAWNSLPEHVASAPSINAFKNRLDKFWPNQNVKYNFKATLSIGRNIQSMDYSELDTEVLQNLNPDTS